MAQLVPRTPKQRHSLGQAHGAVAGGQLRKVRKAAAALGLQAPVVDVLPAADGARPGVAHKREHCGGAGRRGRVRTPEDGQQKMSHRNGTESGLKGVGGRTTACSANGMLICLSVPTCVLGECAPDLFWVPHVLQADLLVNALFVTSWRVNPARGSSRQGTALVTSQEQLRRPAEAGLHP